MADHAVAGGLHHPDFTNEVFAMQPTMSLRWLALALSLTAALAFGACSPAATPSSQVDAEAELCTTIDAFGASVQSLLGLDAATASVDDVQAARAAAGTAWDAVKVAAADVAEADEAALEAAWQGLAASVDDAPTDQPISETVAGVQTAGAAIPAVITEMKDGVGCA